MKNWRVIVLTGVVIAAFLFLPAIPREYCNVNFVGHPGDFKYGWIDDSCDIKYRYNSLRWYFFEEKIIKKDCYEGFPDEPAYCDSSYRSRVGHIFGF